jgi:hypothetical protein
MPASHPIAIEELLDRCIDAQLAGADWRPAVPPNYPRRAELVSLMEFTEEVYPVFAAAKVSDRNPAKGTRRSARSSPDSDD